MTFFVRRDQVWCLMSDLDLGEELAVWGDVVAKNVRQKKGTFSSKGPNWVHSLDGLDKLMGYQNLTFRVLSIQQKFGKCPSAQWNGTFRLHRPDPSHRASGWLSLLGGYKRAVLGRDNSVGPTEMTGPVKVDHLQRCSQIFQSDPRELVRSISNRNFRNLGWMESALPFLWLLGYSR